MIPLLPLLFAAFDVQAQSVGIPAISVDGGNGDGQTYSVTLEILALMTVLTLLPAILLMMTSFTRIIIVLSILRQALGTAQTPSNQIILGLALFLTLFVMAPVLDQVNQVALQPYLDGSLSAMDALRQATEPFKTFMLAQTRETDIRMFADIAGVEYIESPEQTPLTLLMPAFVTSELKTAFQIGFLIFIPFVIIDLVVASVLMSMGMMMLSPMIISLPFKLMLFVLVDGWALIMGTLASSFLLGG
ncbi:MAG: flagellar type III secretion system pore protein FliP [Gammaproteobacteria bacterium]|nr:flagellar type III secretion system pore protein FliP [Gammaproteobacteria bacterium]